METTRAAAAHFYVGQEFEEGTRLPPGEREYWTDDGEYRQTRDYCTMSAQEAALARESVRIVTFEGAMVGARSWLIADIADDWHAQRPREFVAILGSLELSRPVCGMTSVTLGALHIHNKCARERPAATRTLISEFLDACRTHRCDVFGVDANQAMKHLEALMTEEDALIRTPPSDCCGLFLPSTSQLLQRDVRCTGAKYYSTWHPDQGWNARDATSHYPVVAHFRVGTGRTRAPVTAAEKQARKNAARKERRAAAAAAAAEGK